MTFFKLLKTMNDFRDKKAWLWFIHVTELFICISQT